MGWTPPPNDGIDVPEWTCQQPLARKERPPCRLRCSVMSAGTKADVTQSSRSGMLSDHIRRTGRTFNRRSTASSQRTIHTIIQTASAYKFINRCPEGNSRGSRVVCSERRESLRWVGCRYAFQIGETSRCSENVRTFVLSSALCRRRGTGSECIGVHQSNRWTPSSAPAQGQTRWDGWTFTHRPSPSPSPSRAERQIWSHNSDECASVYALAAAAS